MCTRWPVLPAGCECGCAPSFPPRPPCATHAAYYATAAAQRRVLTSAAAALTYGDPTRGAGRVGCWLVPPPVARAAAANATEAEVAAAFAAHAALAPHARVAAAPTSALLARWAAAGLYAPLPPLHTPAGLNLLLVAAAVVLSMARSDGCHEAPLLAALAAGSDGAPLAWPAPRLTADARLASSALLCGHVTEADLAASPMAIPVLVMCLLRACEAPPPGGAAAAAALS